GKSRVASSGTMAKKALGRWAKLECRMTPL
ncbi:MAG: hypothetical protein ACI9MC_001814, partial [Kiritimatiellia bacterium]